MLPRIPFAEAPAGTLRVLTLLTQEFRGFMVYSLLSSCCGHALVSPYRRVILMCVLCAALVTVGVLLGRHSAQAGAPAKKARGELEDVVDYSRDIRPILAANCFVCHGADPDSREADLRLDRSKDATADRDGGAAIVPGDPRQSAVVQRINEQDDDLRMPPAGAKKKLAAEQIARIERWISQGATYTRHWAFVQPKRAPLPPVRDAAWPRNPIDRFILAQLEMHGLHPSPEADRHTLIRRVSLDLIGLPPTPEQADAFVADTRPDAYERLVDRLLDSPHYGERWARRWLDLARYSDTNGYEKDRVRSMWPYRDWVINALNADMPFNQFTVEQIAGDMLPNATLSQRIATGFHRNTMINEEGGIDPQEYRFLAVVDRVATTGVTWLGLSLGCARCHSHKYDPISQTEYYQFFAMLDDADEIAIDVPTTQLTAERESIEAQIATLRRDVPNRFAVPAGECCTNGLPAAEQKRQYMERKFAEWLDQARAAAVAWEVLTPLNVQSNLPSIDVLDDRSVLASGDQTKNDTFVVTASPKGRTVAALRLEALPHATLPEHGPGRRTVGQGASAGVGDFFLSTFTAEVVDLEGQAHKIVLTEATRTFAAKDRDARFAIDSKGDTGWSIAGRPGTRHVAVFRPAKPITLAPGHRLRVRLEHESFYPSGLGRFRLAVTDDPRPIEASPISDNLERTLLRKPQDWSASETRAARQYYLSIAPELNEVHEKIAALSKQLPHYPTAMVMQQRPARHHRVTHLHHRGEYLQPKQVVQPGVPAALHPFRSGTDPDRLALARWLVDPHNPLVGRVTVNRQWQAFFGRGLVRTTEDLGTQGALPTHPKLLDWLAVHFVENGWSLKRLHRLIVTSATYRQAAGVTRELRARDPNNQWLSRAPRVRLSAELIRDVVLSASGQLSAKIGGPSVFPPQPAGITEAAYGPLPWTLSQGEDRYRRGLYTFNKRTAPYAAYMLFDAPSGESCLPRRAVSNTPLQALNMMNDPVVVEAAQVLARQAMKRTDQARRATFLFRRCLTRPPEPAELKLILQYFQQQQLHLTAGENEPWAVIGGGELRRWSFATDAEGWVAGNQCELNVEKGLLNVLINGNDPFFGTPVTGPAGPYRIAFRAHFNNTGQGQVFWRTKADPAEAAGRSVKFTLQPDKWNEYEVRINVSSPLTGLRLDPGSTAGLAQFDWVRLRYGSAALPSPKGVDLAELAGWTLVARALLNVDELIMKP